MVLPSSGSIRLISTRPLYAASKTRAGNRPSRPHPKQTVTPPAIRVKHEYITDISLKGTTTTCAGILNPHHGGSVQDAYNTTFNHLNTPIRLGRSTISPPPANTVISEMYAQYIGLSLWQDRFAGGEVTCLCDNITAVEILKARGRGPVPTSALPGRASQRAIGWKIAGHMAKMAKEKDIKLVYAVIPRSKNRISHDLSRYSTEEDMAKLDPVMREQVRASAKRMKRLGTVGLASQSLLSRLFREVSHSSDFRSSRSRIEADLTSCASFSGRCGP